MGRLGSCFEVLSYVPQLWVFLHVIRARRLAPLFTKVFDDRTDRTNFSHPGATRLFFLRIPNRVTAQAHELDPHSAFQPQLFAHQLLMRFAQFVGN